MPFDATPVKPIDRLIEALRGPEREDWDFGHISYCACGIAARIGIARSHMHVSEVGERLGMSEAESGMLLAFVGCPGYVEGDDHAMHEVNRTYAPVIRQRHVLAALENWRDTGEALSPFEFVRRERV